MLCFRFPRPLLHTTPRINSALLHVMASRLHGAFHFHEMSCSMMRVPARVPLSPPRLRAGRSDGLHVSKGLVGLSLHGIEPAKGSA
jgi:hypothetical protein